MIAWRTAAVVVMTFSRVSGGIATMMTLEKHIESNWPAIEAEAAEYARNFNVHYDRALQDVADEYEAGFFDEAGWEAW